MSAIKATEAQQIIVTHGSIPTMVRWLCQNGLDAKGFDTEYGDEEEDEALPPAGAAATKEARQEKGGETAAGERDA
jgi:putative mRNA 3-end processing factor